MKVTIRVSTNTSYSVTIPDNSTVQDLRDSANVACPSTAKLPADFKLIYNGEKLDPYYKALLEFGITDDITVILMSNGALSPLASPSLQPAPKKTTTATKTKRAKCSFKACSSTPLRMVGDCSHCNGKFCAKHRLLEDHHCQDLQFCRDSAHERNAMKLHNDATLASSKV